MQASKTMWTVLLIMSFLSATANGCNPFRRADRGVARLTESLQRQTDQLGARLQKAVDNLSRDVSQTLSDLEVKMNILTNYVTRELGPSIEKTLKNIDRNVDILVSEVTLTLHKANIVIDKASHCIDLITVLIFVLIGTFCKLLLSKVDFGLWIVFVVFVQTVSFVCAPVLLIAYVWRLCTGQEPSPQVMAKLIMIVILFIPLVYILRIIWPILAFIFYFPFILIYVLTVGPFKWLSDASWKWKKWQVYLLHFTTPLILALVWLLAFTMTSDNIVNASLITYGFWWCISATVRILGPRPPSYREKIREQVRQKRLGYYT